MTDDKLAAAKLIRDWLDTVEPETSEPPTNVQMSDWNRWWRWRGSIEAIITQLQRQPGK